MTKAFILLVLVCSTFLLITVMLVGCGGAPEPTPDIDATVEARLKERLAAIPTPTARIVEIEVVKEVVVEKEVIVEKIVEVETPMFGQDDKELEWSCTVETVYVSGSVYFVPLIMAHTTGWIRIGERAFCGYDLTELPITGPSLSPEKLQPSQPK